MAKVGDRGMRQRWERQQEKKALELPRIPQPPRWGVDEDLGFQQAFRMMMSGFQPADPRQTETPASEECLVPLLRGRRQYTGSSLNWQFASLSDLVDQVEHRWESGYASDMRESRSVGDSDWAGTRSLQGALDLARNGWKNGLDKVSRLFEEIQVTTDTMGFDYRPGYDVAGPYPVVPIYVGGDPEHFALPAQQVGHHPVLEIAFQAGGNAGVSATQLMNFGAALLAYVDRLEAASWRVGVTVLFSIGNPGLFGGSGPARKMLVQTRLKNPEDPVSLDTLAFGLAHPAMFRRFAFAMLESCNAKGWRDTFNGGYGSPRALRTGDLVDLPDAVILPEISSEGEWGNPRAAVDSMRKILLQRVSGLRDEQLNEMLGAAA